MKHLVLILAAVVACLNAELASSSCINPFTKIGNKYYYIERYQKLNWFAAAARCMELGGQLATIESEAELEHLTAFVKTQAYTAESSDLIFISGFGKPGAYLALSEPPRLLPYVDWTPGEPDDHNSYEDCLWILLLNGKLRMGDISCRNVLQFICETKAPVNQASGCS